MGCLGSHLDLRLIALVLTAVIDFSLTAVFFWGGGWVIIKSAGRCPSAFALPSIMK